MARRTRSWARAASTARRTSSSRARLQPRAFLATTYLPASSQVKTGLILSTVPRRYSASPMRPPLCRKSRLCTEKNTRVLLATPSRTLPSEESGMPASTWRTASITTRPAATPMLLVSTTTTGKPSASIWRATMLTVS